MKKVITFLLGVILSLNTIYAYTTVGGVDTYSINDPATVTLTRVGSTNTFKITTTMKYSSRQIALNGMTLNVYNHLSGTYPLSANCSDENKLVDEYQDWVYAPDGLIKFEYVSGTSNSNYRFNIAIASVGHQTSCSGTTTYYYESFTNIPIEIYESNGSTPIVLDESTQISDFTWDQMTNAVKANTDGSYSVYLYSFSNGTCSFQLGISFIENASRYIDGTYYPTNGNYTISTSTNGFYVLNNNASKQGTYWCQTEIKKIGVAGFHLDGGTVIVENGGDGKPYITLTVTNHGYILTNQYPTGFYQGNTNLKFHIGTPPSSNHNVTIAKNNEYGTISRTSITDVPDGSSISLSGENNKTLTINSVSVTAEPITSTAHYTYTFDGWTNASGTITADRTITANFSRSVTKHAVSATVSPAEAGTVTGTGSFDYGDDVTLTASPANRRYRFVRWTESASEVATTASYTINSINAAHTLVAEFEEIPVTLDDNGTSDYYTATLSTFSTEMDFQMMRTFYAGMWNTVCFPFDLTASQITASDMSTATFYTLSSVTGDPAEGLDFNVSEVTSLSARTPYLVQVSGANIVNPVFKGVTLAASAFTNNTTGTNVGDTRFFGTVHPTALETGENSGFLFLGQNNALYWPNVANKIRAFRAYFYSGNSIVQAVHPRARIVVRSETPTDVMEGYNADTWSAVVPARKVLDNGNLIIERDGKKYNAVGQEIK